MVAAAATGLAGKFAAAQGCSSLLTAASTALPGHAHIVAAAVHVATAAGDLGTAPVAAAAGGGAAAAALGLVVGMPAAAAVVSLLGVEEPKLAHCNQVQVVQLLLVLLPPMPAEGPAAA